MRVPPQRSSRSNTAPSGGKRISTSSSTSNAASSSGKKRKLHSDSSTKPTHKQSPDASTSNTGSKRKPSLPNVRKTTYHPKRADTASSTKNPKSDSGVKKSQTRKSISIPLVGLKKIKIKEGKVTVKKILMTAAATKSQKKIVKSSVKCTPSKKSVAGGNKKTAGTSTSSVEAVSASSSGELQASSSSSVGRISGESEDQNPSQKKTQCRNPASSKFNTKKTKVIIKKSKAPSITSVPVPLTRTKKLQQTQNLKSVKKICLKKYPATKQVMVQQATIGKKKKIITRKKNTTGENSGNGEGQLTQKSNESPSSNQNEGQSSASADNVQSGANVSATQSAEKGSGKGNTKKAKDEESAIKKSDKKKIVKKKPKMEDSGKGSTAVSEETPSEIISETTKEETVASPKKENKNDSKDETATKGKCVKKSKAIPSESSAVKGKSTKKPPIVKSVKVISTKLKKITDSKPSNSKVKKVQQPKKKVPKSSVKKIVAKEQLPIDTKQEVSEGKERKPPKNTESNDEDSSTSDEITLDVLLMRQQMKQENVTSDDTSPEQQTASEPCSPVSSTEKLSSPQDIENKSYIPLMSSVKIEESAPSSTVATLSPATVNTSDDEDLKSIKNKIKIKLEESNTDDGKKSPAMPDKTSKKKSVATKSKTSDSSASRSKYVGTSIKKEPKDDSDKSEKKKSESDSKSSSDKDRPKKILGVKKSATGVKRTRSESGKNGSSGSDTEQRARRMKLFGFWSGIKRHRVASLNALAKVHCLYENESRGALLGLCGASSNSSPRAPKSTPAPVNVSTEVTVTTTRTLRSAPGLRGMGKHWDMHNASSTSSSSTSSDENESNSDSATSTPPPSYKQKRRQQKVTTTTTTSSSSCGIKKKTTKQIKNLKKVVKRRRNRCELMMDLKDMVVRKRMASLNASAILAASYSVEKRPAKTNKDETGVSGDAESSANNAQQGKKKTKKRLVTKKIVEVEDDSSNISSDVEVEECDLEGRGSSRSVIEVRTTPSGGGSSNKKVAVILNQDTDVTITGVYVNSTTRSTHHEGFCSIAGMQYRISSTSHTQTEATAVATETVLHTSTAAEHPPPQHHPAEPPLAAPIKSYTPLGALSNMQPPGSTVVGGPPPHHHHHPHPHPHPHSHPPPCNVPPQQPPPPPPHRGPVNPPAHPPISPLGRRHGCSSAFSAPPPPPTATYGPPPQHPQPPHHHPPHPPPQGQQDPAYMHGYYQPAGPLISTHHHHHSSSSSSSSSITNTGKVPPAVLPTLEASPNPTPPPSATGHSGPVSVPTSSTTAIAPPVPQQLVSATSSGSGGGGARSGGDESDNDVIITATSCSGGGEVAPPPPVPQPLPLQQHPHQASYRYPQSYPPPPTPSTPQHIHHQSYTYNYPHTQYYPSPPSSASIQYSAVATNPPSLQQHHTHYHNQDLCYSSSASYPPASYFHHKSYSTPPPSSYRRYIPPPHPAQYYTSDLYSSPASNASQQNSGQSQQSQQMVVTGSSAGSASSYQPPAAPPPPPLVGVSSNPPPPPLVDSFPPPVSIVDPYPPPAYYTGYSAGPGAAGCYAHSSPTRSLAFIDAAYQSCPCPMQSCPKNVHTGPLTGDGKGPHITTKQQQPQPVQESGASFHQLPLPPVALALPLEPPGALGPPSPARGSAGMPPPPSPATASARNPSHAQEEAAFQQRGWELDVTGTGAQSKLEATSKQEPVVQDYVGETKLMSTLDSAQDLQSKPDKEFGSDTTTLPSDEAVGKTDISRHRLLAISKVVSPTDGILCRTNKKKSPTAINNVPLLMCDVDFQKRHISSEVVLTKPEDITIVDTKMVNNSVKLEVRNLEKEVFVDNSSSQGVVQNGSKTIFRNGSSRKRKIQSGSDTTTTTTKAETDTSVPKRRNLSTSNGDTSRLSVSSQESQKTDGGSEAQDQVNSVPLETQTKCKNGQKMQPLSSNSCSLHNAKNNVRKRKLDDADLTENKEPQTVPSKKKGLTKPLKEQRLQTKIYPSRMKQMKKIVASKDGETMKKVDEVVESVVAKGRTILEPLSKRNISSNVAPLSKKTPGNKSIDRKKSETKINGVLSQQKKPSLRHQAGKHEPPSCLNGLNRVTQTNASRARMEGKKVYQRKKSEHSSLSGRVNHMLRSHSLRDSLSDHSSDDADSNTPRGKASSCPSSQNPSSISTVRRASTGSRKDQSKKPGPPVRNDGASSLKKQTQQQHAGSQDMATVVTLLSRKIPPKKPLQQSPKWSNGWKFEGDPFESKVFLSSDDVLVSRKCYPLMRHEEGDVICPRDCILLKSGPRKTDLPFVAKVAALWENPDDGEMMVSLLWYYRPEHTDHGRRPDDMEDEIFASKHKDINSVACIEDKCYVLTFNEYCRYRKCVRRLEDGVREPGLVVPQHHGYPRENRQPPGCVAPELVFFCRRVYDFRQRRILKNPG